MPLPQKDLMHKQEVSFNVNLDHILICTHNDAKCLLFERVFAIVNVQNFFHIADREVQRILLELLNQMDGFDQNVNVKVNCCEIFLICIIVDCNFNQESCDT